VTRESVDEILNAIIQMNAFKNYFFVVLFLHDMRKDTCPTKSPFWSDKT